MVGTDVKQRVSKRVHLVITYAYHGLTIIFRAATLVCCARRWAAQVPPGIGVLLIRDAETV